MTTNSQRPTPGATRGLSLERPYHGALTHASSGADAARKMPTQEWAALRARAHGAVLEHFQSSGTANVAGRETVAGVAERSLDEVAEQSGHVLPPRLRAQLVEEVTDEVVGFGPLQPLLDDPTVNEVMVNGPHQIYVERRGQLELTDRIFLDDAHAL